jgi:hypothetical protein
LQGGLKPRTPDGNRFWVLQRSKVVKEPQGVPDIVRHDEIDNLAIKALRVAEVRSPAVQAAIEMGG